MTYQEEKQNNIATLNNFAAALITALLATWRSGSTVTEITYLASDENDWSFAFIFENVPYWVRGDFRLNRVEVCSHFGNKNDYISHSNRGIRDNKIGASIEATDTNIKRVVNRLVKWHKELKPLYERAIEAFNKQANREAQREKVKQEYQAWKQSEGFKGYNLPGDVSIFNETFRDGGKIDLDVRSLSLEQAQHIINYLRGKDETASR